jgi:hypothetical protein
MPPAPNSYYPPAAYPPPGNPYNTPPTSAPQPPAANPALTNLPPNILALLQSAQQQQRPPTAPGQAYTTHFMGTPPPGTAAPATAGPQYQQLMAYLVRYIHIRSPVF